MNQIARTPPTKIRARIHDNALKRVTRIYLSTLADVLTETLQNSRRGGATIKGFEVMRALRKGQAGMFALQGGIVGEARIVERAFDLGPCALTEAVALLQDRLANAET